MNKFFKKSLIILSGLLSITMSSCSDIFDTDSDRLLFEKDHNMSSINDTLYSMACILSSLQHLCEVVDYYFLSYHSTWFGSINTSLYLIKCAADGLKLIYVLV